MQDGHIVPHKIYQSVIQETSRLTIDLPAKHNRRSWIEILLETLHEY